MMSYKKRIPEANKYIIVFLVGLCIAVAIFPAWLFSLTKGEFPEDFSLVMIVLFMSLLVVEVPITVIVISLTYRYKVVKMKPKSSYKIENIDNYLQAHEQYRKGNYEYETIKSEFGIVKAYESGKKIVFTAIVSGEKIGMWMGIGIFGLFLIFAIVITGITFDPSFYIFTIGILVGIGAIFLLIFFLPNIIKLKKLPRSFFVLGREGIVYRRKWGDIRSYSWKELNLKFYSVKTVMRTLGVLKTEFPPTIEIQVILPNRAKLKFKPEKYCLDEFYSFDKLKTELKNSDISRSEKFLKAELKRNFTYYLVGKTFGYYFNSGKSKTSTTKKDYDRLAEKMKADTINLFSDARVISNLETIKSKHKDFLQGKDKFQKMLDTYREILEAIMKIEEEYKKLMDRKNAGESVDNLIAENRREKEKLEKEDKEKSEIMSKWAKSEEGRKMFESMAFAKTIIQMNPIMQIKHKIIDFEKKINKKELDYRKLVERKNKGEYVYDLIIHNRNMVRSLEKDKKKMEAALADLER